jgi:hypothetical protein
MDLFGSLQGLTVERMSMTVKHPSESKRMSKSCLQVIGTESWRSLASTSFEDGRDFSGGVFIR